MDIKLASGEAIIKSWKYAKSGNTFDSNKVEHNLILTNKRVISLDEGKNSIDRQEIPLSAAKGIDGSALRGASFWTYLKLIFGILTCWFIVGIFIIMSAVKTLRSCVFELIIYSSGAEGTPLCVGLAGAANNAHRFHLFGNSLNKFKVYVDKKTAFSMLDELGAAITEAQNAQ